MQPYFFPYVGYFQLIAAVDVFVVYDNIKYVKSGWINRNRLLRNGEAATFSLPLKGASDHLEVRDREIAADFRPDKLLNQIHGAYGQAPQFGRVFPLTRAHRALRRHAICSASCINRSARCANFSASAPRSEFPPGIGIDHSLRKQDKVLALCRALGAVSYVNAIGGMELYSPEDFRLDGIELRFVRSRPFEYPQLGAPFVPSLSIIDVLMFNPTEAVRDCVFGDYELI